MPNTSIQGRANGNNGFDFPALGSPIDPVTFFTITFAGNNQSGIPPWSYFPQYRDRYLRALSKLEPIMSGALYSVTSRVKSLRWDVTGGRNDKKYYQSLLAEADGGQGYGEFISKIVTDLLTQDNGAFIELVGAGREDKPLKGRVREIWQLDSAQCWRTFDPEFPVIYQNPLDNSYKRLHQSRVIRLSSFPQPDERARSVGFCAVSRAFKFMQTMRAIETYKEEKVSGKFKNAILYGNGFTPKTYQEAIKGAEEQSANNGWVIYNEIPVMLSSAEKAELNILNLASLPDGFNWEQELNNYVYALALAFGTDAREFWPATASGATKADASIQHLKAQGKGLADIIKTVETALNWHVMPGSGSTVFEYDFKDDEQDKAVAELQTVKLTNIITMQTNGWLDAVQALSLAISQGIVDPKDLIPSPAPEQADDSAPMDDDLLDTEGGDLGIEPDNPADTASDTGAPMDTALKAGPATATPTGATVPFKEQLHPRNNSGQFGSGGSSPSASKPPKRGGNLPSLGQLAPATTSAPAAPPPSAATQLLALARVDDARDLTGRLKSFLNILNQRGSFSGNQLTIKQQARDRSADLQKYLQHKGFPDAKVTAKREGKGFVYTIEGAGKGPVAKQKKPRKKKTGDSAPRRRRSKVGSSGKAIAEGVRASAPLTEKRTNEYADALEALVQSFLDKAEAGVDSEASLDAQLKTLYSDFLDLMPTHLSAAFGIGLAGAKPTKAGITKLKKIGTESADYFKTSMIPALKAAALAGEFDQSAEDVTAEDKGIKEFLARARMYAGAYWESIWRGVGDRVGKADLKVKRVLDPGAEHCKTCPPKQKTYNSYSDMVAVAGVPGDGSDDCLSNCRCKLLVETEPGSDVFTELFGTPTVFVTPLFEVIP